MMLFFLDELWCGPTQAPASLLFSLTEDRAEAKKLAWLRIKDASALLFELIGYFLITYGLAVGQHIGYFAAGILLKTFGNLSSSIFQNQSGVLWTTTLQSHLLTLKTHGQEIGAYLVDRGCTEAEAQAISTIPAQLYESELNCFQRARLFHLGKSFACGSALFLIGEYFSAILIPFLGIISLPIGEYFFKDHIFRSDSELRIGQSAGSISFIQKVYQNGRALSLKMNLFAQLPILLFALKFLSKSSTHLLAILFAYTQGLNGLVSALAFQRTRSISTRTTRTTRHLIDALTSPAFLITETRWKNHCSQKQLLLSEELTRKVQTGLALHQFTVFLPSRQKEGVDQLQPLTCTVPGGGIGLIRAPSGYGKTSLFLALSHLINHKGDMFFVEKGEWKNVHELPKDALEKKIFFFRENNIEHSARLVDLFRDVALQKLPALYNSMKDRFGPVMADLAWHSADNLIEHEILSLEEGNRSAFSLEMKDALCQMRHDRSKLLSETFKSCQGNLLNSRIYPERLFNTLSAGEKKRVIALLALEQASIDPEIHLVILDEPFTNLDLDNMQDQMTTLHRIQELPRPPVQLLISHHFMDEMTKNLSNIQSFTI